VADDARVTERRGDPNQTVGWSRGGQEAAEAADTAYDPPPPERRDVPWLIFFPLLAVVVLAVAVSLYVLLASLSA